MAAVLRARQRPRSARSRHCVRFQPDIRHVAFSHRHRNVQVVGTRSQPIDGGRMSCGTARRSNGARGCRSRQSPDPQILPIQLHPNDCHGMAIIYTLWPCRNRPREGPENLAKIETRAMGFLATPKARSARSLASASTPAFRHRISTRSGCSCGSCESSWNAVAGRRSSSLLKRSSPDPGGAWRETVCPTLRGGAR